MEFFFDTETTGIPKRSGNKYACHKKLENYDCSRIVSISWIVTQKQQVVVQAYYVIKPDGFEIPQEASAIHKISTQEATSNGVPITQVFEELKKVLPLCVNMVAHNIAFDVQILKSELWRYGYTDMVSIIDDMHQICTMKKGKEVLKSKTYPKLQHLVHQLFNEDMTAEAHNAQADTYYCYKCYTQMFPVDKSVFFFGDRSVKLTDAQQEIVYQENDKNILVVACAGAGKTLTVLCRVKHLIEQGVPESAIMMTTFTRDAANDMKNKLYDIMGYNPRITVGTIDSIAKRYCSRYNVQMQKDLKNVSEYGHDYLKLIKEQPDIMTKYKYLFVDEFQDINDTQFSIIQEFYKHGCKVFGVGDDAQNIYTFRGSKIEFILKFKDLFDHAVVLQLTNNFRSTSQIIDIANASIEKNENNMPKTMIAANGTQGPKPRVRFFSNAKAHNETILQEITALLAQGVAHHEIAVLSPVNQSLYLIEEKLTQHDICNVYLDGKCDVKTSKKPWHVCLSTIHKSKGLEWDYVFLINMSDEILPKMKNPQSIEESRRLFYVAITRARKDLRMYYTVMIPSQPFVTRYISELEREKGNESELYVSADMTEECFGISDIDIAPIQNSVTKLIDNLDGADYIYLKEQGILPKIQKEDFITQKLYESYNYAKVIVNNDLYSDFGIFVEKLIKRELAKAFQKKDLCKDRHVIMCLANLKLEPQYFSVYQQYKVNFKNNLKRISGYLHNVWGNSDTIKKELEQNGKFIQTSHFKTIQMILISIKQKADQYKIEPCEVPVFSKSFLPQGFEKAMKTSMETYKDLEAPTDISKVWDISKCKKIVMEYRRRLLYKNIDISSDLSEYTSLFERISTDIVRFITDMKPVDITVDEKLEAKEGMFGEMDLRVDGTIIDYKTSINDNMDLQWLTQLLCYKALADINGKKINKVAILNPLRGWYSELDVSGWDKQHELIDYLLLRRNSPQK